MRAVLRIGLTSAVLVGMVAACGDDDDGAADTAAGATTDDTSAATEATTEATGATTAAATTPPVAEPAEYTVMIDGRVDEFNGVFFGYFPDKVSVHPGDTIVYHSMFTGEPHTARSARPSRRGQRLQASTPSSSPEEEPPPPELEAAFALIPAMLPDGPGDANQNSVNPCFVAEGEEMPADRAAQCDVTERRRSRGPRVLQLRVPARRRDVRRRARRRHRPRHLLRVLHAAFRGDDLRGRRRPR